MNKFDEILKGLGDLHKKSNSMDFSHHEVGVQFMDFTNKYYNEIRTALTQAAEIERGDKVVVTKEMLESWIEYSILSETVQDDEYPNLREETIAMITASEGK